MNPFNEAFKDLVRQVADKQACVHLMEYLCIAVKPLKFTPKMLLARCVCTLCQYHDNNLPSNGPRLPPLPDGSEIKCLIYNMMPLAGVAGPVQEIESTPQYYNFTCIDGVYDDDTIQFRR